MAVPSLSIIRSEVLKNLDEQAKEESIENGLSSINCFAGLRMRELGSNMKVPHIYRDYHLQDVNCGWLLTIDDLVIADDIVCVVHGGKHVGAVESCSISRIVPFTRQGDQIIPLTDDHGRSIICRIVGSLIKYICYNDYNSSLIIVVTDSNKPAKTKIISVEIAYIKAGLTPPQKRVFPGECMVDEWDFDIPNCRGMIHSSKERVFKVCELKDYRVLFTIPDLGVASIFKFGSPGNMEMVMYEPYSTSGSITKEGTSVRIYSKSNGELRKEFFVAASRRIQIIALCGSDRMVMQENRLVMKVMDISSETPVLINRTGISLAGEPYYLHKRCPKQFICYDRYYQKVHVCNLQGEILVTLEDHPMVWRTFLKGSYISNSQDIVISVCRRDPLFDYTINFSSIVTGKCLGKITMDIPSCSPIRYEALRLDILAFAYDPRTHQIFTGNYEGIFSMWSKKIFADFDVYFDLLDSSSEEEEE